jgi:hypothetical protein
VPNLNSGAITSEKKLISLIKTLSDGLAVSLNESPTEAEQRDERR